MKTISLGQLSVVTVLINVGVSLNSMACGDVVDRLDLLSRHAISADSQISARAITALRARGQAGLDALFKVYEQQIALARSPAASPGQAEAGDARQRLKAALEAVSQQRDCEASKLFWHTDLEAAKAAAIAS